jgi:hypothetical protein
LFLNLGRNAAGWNRAAFHALLALLLAFINGVGIHPQSTSLTAILQFYGFEVGADDDILAAFFKQAPDVFRFENKEKIIVHKLRLDEVIVVHKDAFSDNIRPLFLRAGAPAESTAIHREIHAAGREKNHFMR